MAVSVQGIYRGSYGHVQIGLNRVRPARIRFRKILSCLTSVVNSLLGILFLAAASYSSAHSAILCIIQVVLIRRFETRFGQCQISVLDSMHPDRVVGVLITVLFARDVVVKSLPAVGVRSENTSCRAEATGTASIRTPTERVLTHAPRLGGSASPGGSSRDSGDKETAQKAQRALQTAQLVVVSGVRGILDGSGTVARPTEEPVRTEPSASVSVEANPCQVSSCSQLTRMTTTAVFSL